MKRVIFGCFLFYLGVYGYGFKVYVKYPFAIDSRLRDTVVVDSICRSTPVEVILNSEAKGLSVIDTFVTSDSGYAEVTFNKWPDGSMILKNSISSIDIKLINISHEIGRGPSAVFEPVEFKGLSPESVLTVTIPAPFVNPANEVNIGSGASFVKLGIMTDIHIGTNGAWLPWQENTEFCASGYNNPWNGCMGDDGQENCILQNIAVRDRLNSLNLDYVMLTGDFTQSAEREEFECFKALIADSLYTVYFPILGNHDSWPYPPDQTDVDPDNVVFGGYFMQYGGFKKQFIKIRDSLPVAHFQYPAYLLDSTRSYEQYDGSSVFWPSFFTFYSFDYQNYHFLFADFNSRGSADLHNPGSEGDADINKLKWFFQDFDRARSEGRRIIVFAHHPLIPSNLPGDAEEFDADELHWIDDSLDLRGSNVYFEWWFGGHEHENRDNTTTLVSGDTIAKHVYITGQSYAGVYRIINLHDNYFLDFTSTLDPLSEGRTYRFVGYILGSWQSSYIFDFGDGYSSGGSSESMIKSHTYAISGIKKVTLDAVINNRHYTIAHTLIIPDIRVNSPSKGVVLEPGTRPEFSFYAQDPVNGSYFKRIEVYCKINNDPYTNAITLYNDSHSNPYSPAYSEWSVPDVFSSNDTFKIVFVSHSGYTRTMKIPFQIGLNPPTITSLTFQDSVVKITWNDNSRKNKEYYVGKLVHGQSSYTGHDTTFWYHMGHYLGDATSFIDTFPIEGENIYRVAAIDSTNYYWYSDYDTIL